MNVTVSFTRECGLAALCNESKLISSLKGQSPAGLKPRVSWRRLTCHSSLHQGTAISCIYSLTELHVLRTLRRILHWAPWVQETERSLWPLKHVLVTITRITAASFSSSRIILIYFIFIHLYWELEKCLKWESSSPIVYSFKHVLFIFLPL